MCWEQKQSCIGISRGIGRRKAQKLKYTLSITVPIFFFFKYHTCFHLSLNNTRATVLRMLCMVIVSGNEIKITRPCCVCVGRGTIKYSVCASLVQLLLLRNT